MLSKLALAILVAALPLVAAARAQQHTVTATLDYDFKHLHSCSEKETTGCVKQFNIYELTGGPTPMRKLFSFPCAKWRKETEEEDYRNQRPGRPDAWCPYVWCHRGNGGRQRIGSKGMYRIGKGRGDDGCELGDGKTVKRSLD